MPDAAGLTEYLLNAKYLSRIEGLHDWFISLQKRIEQLHGTANRVSIEQLFDYAAFDCELWHMRQQECRAAGDTPESRAKRMESWLSWLEFYLPGVVIDAQHAADPAALSAFVRHFRRGDTVVTFNYDTVLERALAADGRRWFHGFATEAPADITILKLHGSVDWWRSPPDARGDRKLLFGEGDRECISRAKDLASARRLCERHENLVLATRDTPWPGITALGVRKPLHRLPGASVVWHNAMRALKLADEVYVIGWSASLYDTMARFHFASVLRAREKDPPRVVNVDPAACRPEFQTRMKAVFGDVAFRHDCVQDANWELFARV